ncbi:MAG: biopolymer transporter ExbD [Phycisphaerales bacterium]
MNFAGSRQRERTLGVDMTPMIDIVFQLLIFFLTTAQMADRSRAEIDLPREQGEQRTTSESAGLIINLLADGTIIVGEQAIGLDELERLGEDVLRRAPRDDATPQPLVRADRNAKAELLNDVLRRLERAGYAAVRIGTSPQGGAGASGGAGAAGGAPEGGR